MIHRVLQTICLLQIRASSNQINACTCGHHQMADIEIKSLEAGDREVVFSLPKQEQEQIVVLTMKC